MVDEKDWLYPPCSHDHTADIQNCVGELEEAKLLTPDQRRARYGTESLQRLLNSLSGLLRCETGELMDWKDV